MGDTCAFNVGINRWRLCPASAALHTVVESCDLHLIRNALKNRDAVSADRCEPIGARNVQDLPARLNAGEFTGDVHHAGLAVFICDQPDPASNTDGRCRCPDCRRVGFGDAPTNNAKHALAYGQGDLAGLTAGVIDIFV